MVGQGGTGSRCEQPGVSLDQAGILCHESKGGLGRMGEVYEPGPEVPIGEQEAGGCLAPGSGWGVGLGLVWGLGQ